MSATETTISSLTDSIGVGGELVINPILANNQNEMRSGVRISPGAPAFGVLYPKQVIRQADALATAFRGRYFGRIGM